MMHRNRIAPLAAIAIAILLAACNGLSSTPADLETQAQPVWETSVAHEMPPIYAECLDDTLTVTLTVHFKSSWQATPNGRSLFKQIARPEVGGVDAVVVGDSGREYRYRVTGAHQITDIWEDGERRVFVFTYNIRLIGQGQHPNLLINFRIRTIVNAQGEVVMDEGLVCLSPSL